MRAVNGTFGVLGHTLRRMVPYISHILALELAGKRDGWPTGWLVGWLVCWLTGLLARLVLLAGGRAGWAGLVGWVCWFG